jgi:hypothetical protein
MAVNGIDAFGIKSFGGTIRNPRSTNQFKVTLIFPEGMTPNHPLVQGNTAELKINRVEGIERMSGELGYFSDSTVMDATLGTHEVKASNNMVTYPDPITLFRVRDGVRAEDSFFNALFMIKQEMPDFTFNMVIKKYFGNDNYRNEVADQRFFINECQPVYDTQTNLSNESDNTEKDMQSLVLNHSGGFIIPDDFTVDDIFSQGQDYRTRFMPSL